MYHNRTKRTWSVSISNKFILKIINEYNKIYNYSPSLNQDLYQISIKCFSNYIPIHIIPNILYEEDIDIVTEKIVNSEDSENQILKQKQLIVQKK